MNLICFSWPSVHSFPCSWFSLISIFFFNDFTYLSKLGALSYQLLGSAGKDCVAYQGQPSFHQFGCSPCLLYLFTASKVGGERLRLFARLRLTKWGWKFLWWSQPREEDRQWKKQQRPLIVLAFATTSLLPVTEHQTGRFEAAEAAWPHQMLSWPFLGKPQAAALRVSGQGEQCCCPPLSTQWLFHAVNCIFPCEKAHA